MPTDYLSITVAASLKEGWKVYLSTGDGPKYLTAQEARQLAQKLTAMALQIVERDEEMGSKSFDGILE